MAKKQAKAPTAVLAATWTGCMIGCICSALMYPTTYIITSWPKAILLATTWVDFGKAIKKEAIANTKDVEAVVSLVGPMIQRQRIAGQTV